MPLYKGQTPKSYAEGKLVSLADRPKKERTEIAKKSVEARRKKKEEKLMLQKCLRELLNMPVSDRKVKERLQNMGITKNEDLNNSVALMVSLFKKGLSGDVKAIEHITNMMDKLDLFEQNNRITQDVTVNIIQSGEDFVLDNKTKKVIECAQYENKYGTETEDIEEEEDEDVW